MASHRHPVARITTFFSFRQRSLGNPMARAACLLAAMTVVTSGLFGQQPASTAPLFKVNATYVQGVGPGYWPTAGAGLTLNVAPGTSFCGDPPATVQYAGGTLTLADATTNYVYLNPAANCAPASNTTGFAIGHIPLAKVVTAGGAITSITDVRGWFQPLPCAVGSGGGITCQPLNPNQPITLNTTGQTSGVVATTTGSPMGLFIGGDEGDGYSEFSVWAQGAGILPYIDFFNTTDNLFFGTIEAGPGESMRVVGQNALSLNTFSANGSITLNPQGTGSNVLNNKTTINGTATLTGTANIKNLSGIRFASQFATGSATCGVQEAHNNLPSTGGTIWIDPATCTLTDKVYITKNNVHIFGWGMGTSVLTATSVINSVGGVITVGVTSGNSPAAVSDFSMEGVTVDASGVAIPIYLANVTNGYLIRVEAKNSNNGVVKVFSSTDVTVRDCVVSGGNGSFGDGIYFADVVRPKAIGNVISDITRIGIVTEQNVTDKSSDALFAFNSVRNAHDPTGGETNAAIWLENTNGGRVIGNVASDLSGGNQGTTSSRCVAIGPGASAASTFIIDDLDCSGALNGVVLSSDPLIDAQVSNVSMRKGTLSAYAVGVAIGGGNNVYVDGVTCQTNAYPNSSSGCVAITLAGNTKIISVSNIHVGTMTQSGTSADVNLNSLGGFTLNAFSVSNLNNSLLGGSALAGLLTNGTTQYAVDGLRTGQTSSLGGSSLGAGVCTTGTATVPGAVTNQAAFATPLTYPGDAIYWRARVTAANTVTVYACAAVAATPTASQYVVKVARRIE